MLLEEEGLSFVLDRPNDQDPIYLKSNPLDLKYKMSYFMKLEHPFLVPEQNNGDVFVNRLLIPTFSKKIPLAFQTSLNKLRSSKSKFLQYRSRSPSYQFVASLGYQIKSESSFVSYILSESIITLDFHRLKFSHILESRSIQKKDQRSVVDDLNGHLSNHDSSEF